MKSLNERMNDNVIIVNVGTYSVVVATQGKPEGVIIEAGKTISVLVKDLLSALRGNKFIYGVDEKGTNAILYIDNDEIRELLGFDEYEIIKGKGDNAKDKKKIKKEQVVLSREAFIKNVKVQAKTDFVDYSNSLKDVSNGCKMMISRIIQDERKKSLKGVAVHRFDELEEIISH